MSSNKSQKLISSQTDVNLLGKAKIPLHVADEIQQFPQVADQKV